MHYLPFAFPIIFAFANRFRGGWLPTGHTELTRAIFAATWAGLLAPYIGWWAFAAWLAVFLGSLVGHAKYMGLASSSQYFDLGMTGFFNFIILGYLLFALGHPLGLLFAIACGPLKTLAYTLGKFFPLGGTVKNFEQGPPLGEWFFGLFAGAALALAL